jgi:lysophospholipase L1-like esterase
VRHHPYGLKAGCALLMISCVMTGLVGIAGTAQAAKSPTYYVSLGDSYSVGYQPGLGSTPGYTAVVAKATRMTLVNFGCAGATTTSLIATIGCPGVLPHTAGGATYPTTTQAAAAEAFLSAHRGHIGLVTVSIGGNDVTACATYPNPISCVSTAVTAITKNVSSLAVALRAAAGPGVPLIGLTYPDVILGGYVTAQGSLVDVTKATGAYVPLTKTVHYRPYGTIPAAVASVCTLTWYCAQGNIHAKTKGYTLIGKLVVARFDALRR